MNVTETLICRREISLMGSTYFGFAQNTIHDFQNTVFKLTVALSSTNATKRGCRKYSDHLFLLFWRCFLSQ